MTRVGSQRHSKKKKIYGLSFIYSSILVEVRSKAWVCGRSVVGTEGLNPDGGMDVCLLGVLCFIR